MKVDTAVGQRGSGRAVLLGQPDPPRRSMSRSKVDCRNHSPTNAVPSLARKVVWILDRKSWRVRPLPFDDLLQDMLYQFLPLLSRSLLSLPAAEDASSEDIYFYRMGPKGRQAETGEGAGEREREVGGGGKGRRGEKKKA